MNLAVSCYCTILVSIDIIIGSVSALSVSLPERTMADAQGIAPKPSLGMELLTGHVHKDRYGRSPAPAASPQPSPWTSLVHMLNNKHHQQAQPHCAQQTCSMEPSKPTRPPPMMSCSSAHGDPWMPMPTQPIPEEHVPLPGQFVSGNLRSLSLSETDVACQGPLGSFLRHTTSMQSPNVPNYVLMQKFPVQNLSNLRQEPIIHSIIVHQSYLEYLQFEQSCLHHWSNMISEQIMGETQQTHQQLVRMLATLEAQQQTNAWTRAQAQQRMRPQPPHQAPSAQPRPAQSTPTQPTQSNVPLQVKPATCRPSAQSPTSTKPVNPLFPPQRGADPWAQATTTGNRSDRMHPITQEKYE